MCTTSSSTLPRDCLWYRAAVNVTSHHSHHWLKNVRAIVVPIRNVALSLWPTHPPIQCVPRLLSPGIKRPGHEDILPGSRMSRAIPLLPYLPSCQLYQCALFLILRHIRSDTFSFGVNALENTVFRLLVPSARDTPVT